jgi:hypothetical protein
MPKRVRDGYRYPGAVAFAVAVTHDVGYVPVPERLDVSGSDVDPVAVAITDRERHAGQ